MQARCLLLTTIMISAMVLPASGQTPLSTAFTYQGQLKQSGAPLDGTADLRFWMYDAASAGTLIAGPITVSNVTVSGGLFTVSVDFGSSTAAALDGDARWLQIAARSPAGGGTFTTLTPRQPITATPYALQTRGLFVDSSDKVGIGTTSPLSGLHVVRDWDGQNGALRLDGDRPTMRLTGGAIAGNESWAMHVGSDGPGALQFFRRNPILGNWLNYMNIQPSGNVGIGDLNPNFLLSLGTSLSHTKIALYDGGTTNHYGMGVVSGQFSFHLNSPSARYAFYDSDDLTNEIFSVFGNGVTRVKVLEITGADLAEKFPASEEVEPGMVVSIDPHHGGHLRKSTTAYDRRVAGVVSGANSFSVGAVLGNLPGHEDAPPVALSGRVYVWCDATANPIEPGDLLTTSDTPGHAMKAAEPQRAQGAVLGKAMTRLDSGRGMVLVLVSLQ